ncbi:MAG: Hsp20/alpha crystallin family protein [Candidatus Omnitrophica bacterium]|nr:Hsp20/alpha crystallin family protein [Candidatus Omnitrophota bacterium]
MKQKTKLVAFFVLVLVLGSAVLTFFGFSEEKQDSVSDLKKQIEVLQKKVQILEEKNQSLIDQAAGSDFSSDDPGIWDPYKEISLMQDKMDKMFQESLNLRKSMNQGLFQSDMSFDNDFKIKEENDKYVIVLDMTGLDEAKVDVQIDREVITVKGQRKQEKVKEAENSYYSSKSYASFLRTIPLPNNADVSTMKTENRDGKLIITLNKKGLTKK